MHTKLNRIVSTQRYLYINDLTEQFKHNSKEFPIYNDITKSLTQILPNTLQTDLLYAFTWQHTPEGFDFWHKHNRNCTSFLQL